MLPCFLVFFVRITLFGIRDLVHLNKHYLLNLKHRSNTSNQLLIDRNKIVLYLLNRFKKLFFCLKAEQNRNILYKTSLKEEKMKDKIIAYGKEYIDNFKQNPLSTTAILTMQIIFILGWGTFYMFLCERYIKYIIPGRTYTKSAIYPEAFSLTVIAFVFLFFICKSFKTLFLNNNLLKPKLIILALSLLCAISAYPLQLLLIEAVSFLPQTSVAFWANWQILKLPIQ